jgi:drug/metabolite transporter (DMT)-like permease
MTDDKANAMQRRLGIAGAFIGAFAYGINIPFASLAQAEGVSVAQLSFYRSLCMLIILYGLCMALGQRLLPGPGERLTTLFAGFASGCVGLSYLASVKFNPVALSIVLLYTYPLIVIVIEAVISRRWPDPLRCGVFVTAFIGIVIAVGADLEGASFIGIALALIAGLATAILYVIVSRIKTEGFGVSATMQTVIVPMSILLMLALGDSFHPEVFLLSPWPSFFANAGYAIGFLAIIFSAKRIGATDLSLYFLIEPIIGIVSAAIILDQHPTLLQWGGVALIIAALAVDAIARRPAVNPDTA